MSADELLQIESGTEFHIPWKIDRHELVTSRMVQKGIVAKKIVKNSSSRKQISFKLSRKERSVKKNKNLT